MGLLSRPRNKQKTNQFRSPISRNRSSKAPQATNRLRKIIWERTVFVTRLLIVIFVVLIVGSGVVGVIALGALSLKSGGNIPYLSSIVTYIYMSPIGAYLPKEEKIIIKNVIGLAGIPEYPGSEFVFDDLVSNEGGIVPNPPAFYSERDIQEISTFLSSGQSLYFMPLETDWEEVASYYKEKLTKLGWSHISSVQINDVEKIPGEYYIKEENGLHIYTVSSDIWYEIITKEQAVSGLRDRVATYKAKLQIVQSASGVSVPKSSWWEFKYSRDWKFSTAKNLVYGENNLFFENTKTGTKLSITIVKRFKPPASDVTYPSLEEIARNEVNTWLATQNISIKLSDFKTSRIVVAGNKAVEMYSLDNGAYFMVILNNKNELVYLVRQVDKTAKTDFYEYIKHGIKAIDKD